MYCAVENERLSWELEQVRGLVDMQELAVLRMDIHSLRNQILVMAQREDNAQVGHAPLLHFAFGAGQQVRRLVNHSSPT